MIQSLVVCGCHFFLFILQAEYRSHTTSSSICSMQMGHTYVPSSSFCNWKIGYVGPCVILSSPLLFVLSRHACNEIVPYTTRSRYCSIVGGLSKCHFPNDTMTRNRAIISPSCCCRQHTQTHTKEKMGGGGCFCSTPSHIQKKGNTQQSQISCPQAACVLPLAKAFPMQIPNMH